MYVRVNWLTGKNKRTILCFKAMPKSREQKNVCQKGEETNQILSEKCPHVISTAPESFNAKIKLFRAKEVLSFPHC